MQTVVALLLGLGPLRKGQSILDCYKKGMEISLTQIRDQDFIDIQNQISNLKKSEIEIRRMIFRGQNQGIIPFSVRIK